MLIFFSLSWYLYHVSKKKKRESIEDKNIEKIPEKNVRNIEVIKNKYLIQLDNVELNFREQSISLRECYQKISEIIRMFVFEVTDISTQNYSLSEIKKLNMPVLYELIEEYYEPEFASRSIGDFESSIAKARRVINEWN